MSNNPGKKGKPAPWQKRAAEHRDQALEEYRLANNPSYAEWSKRRSEAARSFRKETGADDFSNRDLFKAMKAASARLRAWDKANPSPTSWDDHKRLETEFAAQYVPRDYS
ncbi:hypothetical protein EN925_16435 [Mesorhizobium sp. M7A.F.Ca.US.006.04.2.1]|uniref:hypothetical protein n=1 Tax=unclassified Mesorhizobium TaxID=325217 RepID=UPI000FC998C9|nr:MULTISPECIES: hypothetical protein [unclassified Mesorhizobium]MBZ9886904.1 hypothetical protein [Mesorhizobium sp. BR1-1-3]RUX74110.1 hypothetical protein EN990_18805 [Mesorhizobium sp. M7A.F.Ca.US.005.03.1.1]RUY18121.1 hypothetical protein EN991_05265 [Mesorhizobium sp. M7A.F.Ca.US.005.03.2.1]RUY31685.1 hypothetical protein EN979_02005 [Mesorhizobium sp. M7A.F.Ca.US.001.04.2.1]RUY44127.1 hypothetical protein EN978_07275 [Mesorhizobium sp. M7A.F.Ca.US.001.04.1.1]